MNNKASDKIDIYDEDSLKTLDELVVAFLIEIDVSTTSGVIGITMKKQKMMKNALEIYLNVWKLTES